MAQPLGGPTQVAVSTSVLPYCQLPFLPRAAPLCSCSSLQRECGGAQQWPQFLPSWSAPDPWVPDGNSRNTDIARRGKGEGAAAQGEGCGVPTRVFPNTERGLDTQSWFSRGSLWPACCLTATTPQQGQNLRCSKELPAKEGRSE